MRYLLLMTLATVLVGGGCSDDSQSADGCVEGRVQSCPCGGGLPDGTQSCQVDGTWSECDCGSGDTDTDTDTDSDTGSDTDCAEGEYNGDFEILEQSDLAALAGFTSITGNLMIYCPSCTDLSELICLTSVGEGLYIWDNDALTNLDGLNGITSVGEYFQISGNDALTDLAGVSGIASVGGKLSIGGNTALTNLDGLSGITEVGGTLQISENYALTNLDGLSALTSIGSFSTYRNDALTNLDGLSGITGSVVYDVLIVENAALTNLDGLSGITSVSQELGIRTNAALPDCEICDLLDQLTGTPTLTSIEDNLDDSCTPVPWNCP